MSETTREMRKFLNPLDGADIAVVGNVRGLKTLTADAIEAVEARVAVQAKRHEDLAAWCAETEARVAAAEARIAAGLGPKDVAVPEPSPAPARRFKPGDRVRFVAEPKWGRGYIGKVGEIARDLQGNYDYDIVVAEKDKGNLGTRFMAHDTDLEPAPTAVQAAPRGFRVGDRVRHTDYRSEEWTVREVPDTGTVICTRYGGSYYADPLLLTLVHAAEAPADPPETKCPICGTTSGCDCADRLACKDAGTLGHQSCGPKVCGCLRAFGCKHGPPEIATLPKPADPDPADLVDRLANLEWINVLRKSSEESAKAILAFLGAEGRLCAPGEVARLTADLASERASALLKTKHAETLTARAEAAETVIDTERADRADLASQRDHWRARAETAEGFLATESDAHRATRAKLAAAEQALDVERRTFIYHDGSADVFPTLEAAKEQARKDAEVWLAVRAERDALRAELDAIEAKPRGKTRKVRVGDYRAFQDEFNKLMYPGTFGGGARAMNAVGLRMKVKP